MNERDKIIEILKYEKDEFIEEEYGYITRVDFEKLADALLANGIGKVAEWKRRAEVAERNDKIKDRALDKACYDKARTYCPNDDWNDVSKHFKNDYICQSEREIEEERK